MSGFSIPLIQSHPESFIGPGVAGVFVQAFQTGVLVNQSIKFWSRSHQEPVSLRILVAFVSAAAFFQTALAFYTTWQIIVLNFGNWIAPVDPRWPDRLQTVINVSMASPVQSFLIWRCWAMTSRRWVIIVPLIATLVASVVVSIVTTAQVFQVDFTQYLQPQNGPAPKIQVDVSFVLSLILPAALDVAVTSILLIYLLRSRSSVYTARFRRIFTQLITISWEAAVPPCACAMATVITYFVLVDTNFWDLFFQQILGKLYVISLFVTLNGRAHLKRKVQPDHVPNLTAAFASLAVPEIHIEMSSNRQSETNHLTRDLVSPPQRRVPDEERDDSSAERPEKSRDWQVNGDDTSSR
ncbi:hypothetical protein JAAARDRAFT_35714 [Jaapia argillacea MUCL 33604]|uniref:DUF6534 domain-containing protein n=1 Tax=Jaapia argillacea MUCL 33604 TaxID=933084 RepID=A0A067Q0U5_9AGAM|nr:hypothetical protein JAAARDRAFT_35714 [Jaapia argillacea MUCL 33604]